MQFEKQKNNNYRIDSRAMDKLIANSIRSKRSMLGVSLSEIGQATGIDARLIEQYELDMNGGSSGRMQLFFNLLKTN